PRPGRGAGAARADRRYLRPRPLPHPKARGRRAVQRAGKLHLHDAAPPVARLDDILGALGALVGGPGRLWRFAGRGRRAAAGGDPGWTPAVPCAPGLVPPPTGSVRLDPVPGIEGYWVETPAAGDGSNPEAAERLKPVLAALLDAERQRAVLAEELATRYE